MNNTKLKQTLLFLTIYLSIIQRTASAPMSTTPVIHQTTTVSQFMSSISHNFKLLFNKPSTTAKANTRHSIPCSPEPEPVPDMLDDLYATPSQAPEPDTMFDSFARPSPDVEVDLIFDLFGTASPVAEVDALFETFATASAAVMPDELFLSN